MANSISAIKRIRQTSTRTARNRQMISRLKTLRKKAVAAAQSGEKKEAASLFSSFVSTADKCAKKKIIHANKAANLKRKTNNLIKGA